MSNILEGKVVVNTNSKTISVVVERKLKHDLYGKFIKKQKKYHVHCDGEIPEIGKTVSIMSVRPISKTKSWKLVEGNSKKEKGKSGEVK